MTSASARLASALADWPLDREQRNLIKEATAGINEHQAYALLCLFRDAESAVTSCANFLMGDAQSEQSSYDRQQPTHEEGLHRATLKFRPLNDHVVVRRIAAETIVAGGIIIPDTAKTEPVQGEVIAVGPGGRDEFGEIVKPDIKVGDTVLFDKWSGTEVMIDGVEYLIMKESNIMGVLEQTVEVRRRVKGAA